MASINYQLDGLEQLEKEFEYLQNHGVLVGVLGLNGGMKYDIALIKEYAVHNEYGTTAKSGKRAIPPRPFFRLSVMTTRAQNEIKEYMFSEIEKVIDGDITGQQYLENVGTFVVKKIKDKIKNYGWKANSPQTSARKNGKPPLMDTHSLYESISYQIVGV